MLMEEPTYSDLNGVLARQSALWLRAYMLWRNDRQKASAFMAEMISTETEINKICGHKLMALRDALALNTQGPSSESTDIRPETRSLLEQSRGKWFAGTAKRWVRAAIRSEELQAG